MVFKKFARLVALTRFSALPGDAEHMFRNGPSVMGCLESKYLNTLRRECPQLEPIKRCQPAIPTELHVYRPLPIALSSVSFYVPLTMPLTDGFHWLCAASRSLSSGNRLLVPVLDSFCSSAPPRKRPRPFERHLFLRSWRQSGHCFTRKSSCLYVCILA